MSTPTNPTSYIDPSQVCSGLSPSDPYYTCAGCNVDQDNFFDAWISLDCPLYYSSLIYTGTVAEYSASGLQIAQSYANNLLTSYKSNYSITDPSSVGYSQFQEVLHQFCANYSLNPGVCQNYLTYQQCANLDYQSLTTVDSEWCGCFVLPDQNERVIYGNNPACYPTCHLADTIQVADYSTGKVLLCSDQVCIIDNVSVNVSESKVGDVNVNSICPGCVGSCDCIINDVDVTGTDLNIQQYCGSNVVCYQTIDGVETEVECQDSSGISISYQRLVLILTAIIILVVVVSIIITAILI